MQPSKRPRVGVDFHVADGIYQESRTHLIELVSSVIRLSSDLDFFLFLNNPAPLPAFSLPNAFGVRMPSRGAAHRLLWQLPRLSRTDLAVLNTHAGTARANFMWSRSANILRASYLSLLDS